MPRNAKPIAEKFVDIHTTFPPEVAQWLRDLGDGVAGRGMRLVVMREWENEKRNLPCARQKKCSCDRSKNNH